MFNRVILIVLDGFGIGALPDAQNYNDQGANTLKNLLTRIPKLSLPNMSKLGLYKLLDDEKTTNEIIGCYGKLLEASPGKDTTTGHWELTGIILSKPFPTYPNGFPKEIIQEFEEKISKKTLGNFPCSGTEIIKMLGEEHIRTGYPIVYTSADSVFQIAAHEEIIPIEQLYEYCRIARAILRNEHNVARVIARPFTGKPPNFVRTPNRRDFSVSPPEETLLDKLVKFGGEVIGIGKIDDIFNNSGITKSIHTKNNEEGIKITLELVKSPSNKKQLIFTNLIDFDMLWGHRRNPNDYAEGLKEFDEYLPQLMESMNDEDILIITSDHGNDPTYKIHTDHTREYVPVLVYGKKIKNGVSLGVRKSFSDVGQTIAELFGIEKTNYGVSFANLLLKD